MVVSSADNDAVKCIDTQCGRFVVAQLSDMVVGYLMLELRIAIERVRAHAKGLRENYDVD